MATYISSAPSCIDQGLPLEVSVVQKLHQGAVSGCAEYHPFLTFLLLFVSRQKVNKTKAA